MKLRNSALRRRNLAAYIFYGVSIAFLILSSSLFLYFVVTSSNSEVFKLIGILSFGVSAIALITTQFANVHKTQIQLAHTFNKNTDGSGTIIIHNTSECDLSINAIYLEPWPLHNSVRQLLKIKSDDHIEIKLSEHCIKVVSENSKVSIATTVGEVNSCYFETPKKLGEEKIAELVEQKTKD
ncbi:hypothetical protein PQE20_08765 [Vibrio harveyi]|uniref:hypothetical protein n=1 Tax=Vibrio TaxID=662 RepID=UPI0006833846|nr:MULTISPECIES: hypothetical protein [Vibrio]MDW2082995.1 hypothetical protein [Vibrio sp. 1640]WCP78979.1 hypothetical protein PQE20_08765 [Vibrio harveyi]